MSVTLLWSYSETFSCRGRTCLQHFSGVTSCWAMESQCNQGLRCDAKFVLTNILTCTKWK